MFGATLRAAALMATTVAPVAPAAASGFLDVSPDWQPIPFSVGAAGRSSRPCGDLSLLLDGVASIASVKAPCGTARRVAARWTPAEASRPDVGFLSRSGLRPPQPRRFAFRSPGLAHAGWSAQTSGGSYHARRA